MVHISHLMPINVNLMLSNVNHAIWVCKVSLSGIEFRVQGGGGVQGELVML